MNKQIIKNVEKGIFFGLICAVILSFARFDTKCDELRQGVLRLHILANSDSKADQELKLKVRNKILEVTSDCFADSDDLAGAINAARANINKITDAALQTVKQEGYDYTVRAGIEKNYFDNRDYDGFTLPAGVYNSLTIRIGAAEGHNWWCVVFPGVCLPAAKKGSLEKSVSSASAGVAKNASKYQIRFKTAEIYEKIRYRISKK
ncbi:MAG: stage II sporulation protein R [Clostridia bacterium]|nr:stage II sporulation protein R [Clostridia bacterium]